MGIPYVIEKDGDREKSYDLYSRMLKDRIIFLNGAFEQHMADAVVAQLLFLESQSRSEDITIYINSPGGEVSSMYAIYDTMNYIQSDIATVGYGQVCSAGSFILSAGTKGKRHALPNTDIMIHELSGGVDGKFNDMENKFEHTKKLHAKMAVDYSKMTGKTVAKLKKDMRVDQWMSSEDAKEYGLIDKVEYTRE